MAERGWRGWVRYGVPGLLLGLTLAWLSGDRGAGLRAQAQPPVPGVPMPIPAAERGRVTTSGAVTESSGTGTIALTTQTAGPAQLLYLIDTRSKAFAVYRIDPSSPKGMVKLEAARQYQWDLKLAEYNNLPPEVSAVESTVRGAGQANR